MVGSSPPLPRFSLSARLSHLPTYSTMIAVIIHLATAQLKSPFQPARSVFRNSAIKPPGRCSSLPSLPGPAFYRSPPTLASTSIPRPLPRPHSPILARAHAALRIVYVNWTELRAANDGCMPAVFSRHLQAARGFAGLNFLQQEGGHHLGWLASRRKSRGLLYVNAPPSDCS